LRSLGSSAVEPVVLAEAFALGVLSAASPCLLPLYPAFVAYLANEAERLPPRSASGLIGLLVLAGVLTAMLIVATVVTAVSAPLGPVLAVLVPVSNAALIVLGIALLLDRNPFARLRGIRIPAAGGPFGTAFLYGLLLGPLALPCAGAFLVALFAIAVDPLDAAANAGAFVLYGLGFGLPLVALSALSFTRGRALVRLVVANHRRLDIAAGALLVVAGVAGLLATL
jgi:cytochrome c-type biogenesis protein